MLSIHTLSGYEGVGKSTIIDHFKKNKGFFVIPETARLIMPLEKTVFKDSNDDLSYRSFISYLTNIHFMLSNNINGMLISDRNLIDSLTYLKLYSTRQKIDLIDVGEFIKKFVFDYNINCFYEDMFLIRHTNNDEYIKNNILLDSGRIYGKNVEQYKKDALKWEAIYIDIANKLMEYGLAKNFYIIDSFPDNKEVIAEIESCIFTN